MKHCNHILVDLTLCPETSPLKVQESKLLQVDAWMLRQVLNKTWRLLVKRLVGIWKLRQVPSKTWQVLGKRLVGVWNLKQVPTKTRQLLGKRLVGAWKFR
jgi:hypothetical protein